MALARRLRKELNKPVVLSYHAKYSYDVERFINASALRRRSRNMVLKSLQTADEVWIPSQAVAAELSRVGYSGGHFVIENGTGINPAEPPSELGAELRTRYNITHSDPVLIFSGRMVWHKNIRLIINALRILYERGFPFKMLFIGDGVDRAAIEDYVSEQKLSGFTHFVGYVDEPENMRAFYALGDLLICPSLTDLAPPSLGEAAACSLPAILVRGSNAAAKVEDSVSGFLCEAIPDSLADTVTSALFDKKQLRRIGTAAKANLYISWDSAAEKMKKRYKIVERLYAERKNIV
jgi:glycosyltransferase involved in cell wall biosynthesis